MKVQVPTPSPDWPIEAESYHDFPTAGRRHEVNVAQARRTQAPGERDFRIIRVNTGITPVNVGNTRVNTGNTSVNTGNTGASTTFIASQFEA